MGWTRQGIEAEGAEDDDDEKEAVAEVETGPAGAEPEPVRAMMEGSAWRRSHSMVSPSDLWPSSRVSWKIRAAHMAGIRTRRPRPFTLVWRSLDAAAEEAFRETAIWVLAAGAAATTAVESGLGR
ncbi:hypothetical protein TorRG33x02_024830, partial [Trema orientale]